MCVFFWFQIFHKVSDTLDWLIRFQIMLISAQFFVCRVQRTYEKKTNAISFILLLSATIYNTQQTKKCHRRHREKTSVRCVTYTHLKKKNVSPWNVSISTCSTVRQKKTREKKKQRPCQQRGGKHGMHARALSLSLETMAKN